MKNANVDNEIQTYVDAEGVVRERKEEPAPVLSAKEELKQTLQELGSRPVVMPIIIAINLAVFAWMLASGVSAMSPQGIEIVDWGGNIAGLTLSGDWWRLGTSMFVHIGIFHIAMNMVVLSSSLIAPPQCFCPRGIQALSSASCLVIHGR